MRTPFLTKLTMAALIAAVSAFPWAESSDFSWSGRLSPGQTIEVKGVNGGIVAQSADSDEIKVTAAITGRDAGKLRVEVVEHGGGVTICAVYPTPSRSGKPNECKPGAGGRMNTSNTKASVRFSVNVPAGIGLVARTVNGKIEANNLASDVDACTVNGRVHVSTSEHASAKTVNGVITASFAASGLEKPANLETVNGRITVGLPSGVNAQIEARTVNGGISSDLPLTVRGKISKRTLTATLGTGGPKLALKTVNGGIRLERK
ncbi:MAG: DUF4097 domain-containing protein [bacterium]|nr:DUF4097 domain-containing protein [bacterium]